MTDQQASRSRRRIILLSIVGAVIVLAVFATIGVIASTFVRSGVASSDGQSTGVSFTPTAGDYSVTFPTEPVTQTVPQTAGDYDLELEMATWTGDGEFYAVNATAYPPEAMEQDIDDILAAALTGMVESTPDATLIESEYTELDGARAISGSMDVGETGTMWFTLSVYSNTQYALLSLGHERAAHDAFVSSFAFAS